MAVSAAHFLRVLEDSRLVNAEDISVAQVEAGKKNLDGKGIAIRLVQQGKLTAYQAKQLLAGHWRGFFLEKYKILEPIGRGGMGLVFKAEHTLLSRIAAVKLLPRQAASDPEAVARFRREARAIAQLEHENIVRVYDVGQRGELHFIAMEFVPGDSLSKLIKTRGCIPYVEAISIIYQVVLGLDHAVGRGIIHRDIKPSNILVMPNGKAKILDMGLARVFDGFSENLSELSLTMSGTVVGTVDYVAPEQADDSHKADVRSDIYSLGCTLYHCLTGQVPFPGGSMMQKLMKHYKAQPTDIRQLRPEVPEELVAIVNRMMAKQPADRFQLPGELSKALMPLLPAAATHSFSVAVTPPEVVSNQGGDSKAGSRLTAEIPAKRSSGQATDQPSMPTAPTVTFGSRKTPAAAKALDSTPPKGGDQVAAAPISPAVSATPTPASATVVKQRPAAADVSKLPAAGTSKPSQSSIEPIPSAKRASGSAPSRRPSQAQREVVKAGPELTQEDIWAAIAAAVPESPPSAGYTRLTEPRPKLKPLRSVAIGSFIVTMSVLFWWWWSGRVGTLLIEFPDVSLAGFSSGTSENQGSVLLDGRPLDVKGRGKEEVKVRAGQHKLVVEWPGFRPLNETVSISRGGRLPIELVPTDQVLRHRELAGLTERVAAVRTDDPSHLPVVELRKQILGYSFKHRGSVEAMGATGLRARLPWPVDALKCEKLSANQVNADGTPNPAAASELTAFTLGSSQTSPETECSALAISPDGQLLACGGKDGSITMWSLATGQETGKLNGHGSSVFFLGFTTKSQSLVSASEGEVKLWDVTKRVQQRTIDARGGRILAVALCADSETLAISRTTGSVVVHELSTEREFTLYRQTDPMHALAFRADGEILATATNDRLELWDGSTGKSRGTLKGFQSAAALEFSPDRQSLSAINRDGLVRLWKVGNWQVISTLGRKCSSMAFGPDGTNLLVANDGTELQTVQSRTAKVLGSLTFAPSGGPFKQMAFSPEGRHVAVLCTNGRVYVLRLKSYQVASPH